MIKLNLSATKVSYKMPKKHRQYRFLDKPFFDQAITVLAWIFRPLGWLLDKVLSLQKKRPHSRRILYSKFWIAALIYSPFHLVWGLITIDELKWTNIIASATFYVWLMFMLRKEIRNYRNLFIHTHNRPVEIGEIITIGPGKDDFFVVTECVPHPQLKTKQFWNLKVRRANRRERLVTNIMVS